MEDRHFLSDPRPVPGLPLPTWEVDILREGVDKPILTLRVDDVSLPPRQRKKKVLWRLPESIEQIPKFGKEDKLRILELFKQQKKQMKREKRKSQTGNSEEYSMLSAQQSLGMLSLDDDMEEENTTETATTNTSATTATTMASTNDSPRAAAPPPGFVPPANETKNGNGNVENGASAPKASTPVKTEPPTETKTPKNGKKKKAKKSSTQQPPSPPPPPKPQPEPQPEPQPKPPQQAQPPPPPQPPTSSTPISPSSNGPSSPLPPPPGIQKPATTTSPPKPTTTPTPQAATQPTPSPPPPLHFFTIPPQGWNFLGEHVAKSYLELLTQGRIPELLQLYAWGAAKSLTVGGAHALCHSPQEIVQQLQSLQGMNLHLRGVLQQPTLHGGVLITVAGMCLSPPHVLPFSHTLILRPVTEGGGLVDATNIRGYQIQNDAFCFLTTDMGAPVHQPQPQQNGHTAVGPTGSTST